MDVVPAGGHISGPWRPPLKGVGQARETRRRLHACKSYLRTQFVKIGLDYGLFMYSPHSRGRQLSTANKSA